MNSRLLGFALLVLCCAGLANAFETTFEKISTQVPTSTVATVFVRPVCQFGMQFLVASLSKPSMSAGSGGVTLVQVFGKDGKPTPCHDAEK
jgi:hypothetical protein